jgi:hypothetical protein
MKTLHPGIMYTPPRGGVQREFTPSAGSRGSIPSVGVLGESGPPTRVQGQNPRTKNCLVNVYYNFIVNLDHSI